MDKNKILMIDDDEDFRESTKIILEAKGYKVFFAENKQEGFEKVKELLPDLIIMDVMMDKMSDGFELTREIKRIEKYKNIPILMLTAVGDKTGFHFSNIAGDENWLPVDEFAEKPLNHKDLISKVQKLLGQ